MGYALPELYLKVRTQHFLSTFYIKTIILPRQARDKHRENSKKSTVFLQFRLADVPAELHMFGATRFSLCVSVLIDVLLLPRHTRDNRKYLCLF
jgi:hypothetical protein